MIQNGKQLAITKGKISELEDELIIKTANRKGLADDMVIASLENMLAQMRTEVKQYLSNSSAPTEDEGQD